MRAANALQSYITQVRPEIDVRIVDTFAYISPLLNKTITEGYVYMATKIPKVFGALYKTTNKNTHLSSVVFKFSNMISKALMPLIKEYQPDIIVTTHPFSTEMASNLKETGSIDIPLICIMTDYAPHKTWINKRVDSYVVANDRMVDVMVAMGTRRELIHPYGIPIVNALYSKKDRNAILTDMGLDPTLPTILIMAGSFGVTNILRIYNNIIKIEEPFQVIVITGRNQKLYEAFTRLLEKQQKPPRSKKHEVKLKAKASKPTKLLFFTKEVDKYMQISDLIITKPGGLTVSEALACNLPLAVFDAIPGQEEENAEFLIDNNMAVKIEKGVKCQRTIQELLSNREKLESMRQACQSFDKSASSKNILSEIERLTSGRAAQPTAAQEGKGEGAQD